VVLVGDATTYSAGDLFTAGFDNAIGPFVCVGSATGAGGANVWTYDDLKGYLAGSPIALPNAARWHRALILLPTSHAFGRERRASDRGRRHRGERVRNEHRRPPPRSTRHDLALPRPAARGVLLATQPEAQHRQTHDRVETQGLDRLDVLLDGHPDSTHEFVPGEPITVTYPGHVKRVELIGFVGGVVRQRRRLPV
jgi:hypothetical protein